jgi:hypothetical protein
MQVRLRKPKRIPFWRNWPLVLAVSVIMSVLSVIAIHAIRQADPAAPATQTATTTATQAPAPSPSIRAISEFERLDNQQAQRVYEQNIWHYNCQKYPAPGVMRMTDLIPTANVVVTINYDAKTKKYEPRANDSRVKLAWKDTKVTLEGATQPTTARTFSWTYRDSTIKHFGLFHETAGGTGIYFNGRMVPGFDPKTQRRSFTTHAANGTRTPSYWIIATDEGTCEGRDQLSRSWWRETVLNAYMVPDAS